MNNTTSSNSLPPNVKPRKLQGQKESAAEAAVAKGRKQSPIRDEIDFAFDQ